MTSEFITINLINSLNKVKVCKVGISENEDDLNISVNYGDASIVKFDSSIDFGHSILESEANKLLNFIITITSKDNPTIRTYNTNSLGEVNINVESWEYLKIKIFKVGYESKEFFTRYEF